MSGKGKWSAAVRAAAMVTGAVLLAAAAGCTATGTPRAAVAGARNPAAHAAGHRAKSSAAHAGKAVVCDPTAASLRPPPGPPKFTPDSFIAKTIIKRGYLIAGVSSSSYNFGYFNPIDGQYEGFDIDMIKAVAKAIFGAPGHIVYKAITDDQRQPDVENGSVDIVAETMTINCKRLKYIDFSSVYFEAETQVLVLKSSTATGLSSLGGQKVCATKGSTSAGIISSYPVKPRLVLVAVPQFTDCLVMLQQGQIAAISTDASILAGLHAQDPFTKVVGPAFDPQPYGLAISQQNPDFVRFVNAVLAQERADGDWAASYERWVSGPGTKAPAPPVAKYAD